LLVVPVISPPPPADAFPLALGFDEPISPIPAGRRSGVPWLSAGFVGVV